MIAPYVFSFLAGGILILLAIFGGPDSELDSGLDSGLDSSIADIGQSVGDLDLSAEASSSLAELPLAFFLSTRFWSFGFCFFGLCGLLLNFFVPSFNSISTFFVSGLTGVIIGFVSAQVMKTMSGRQVNSLVSRQDLIGLLGKVTLPMDDKQRGTIELSVKGSLMRKPAFSSAGPLEIGDEVVVISFSANTLTVVRSDLLSGRDLSCSS